MIASDGCCTGGTAGAVDDAELAALAALFRLLADPVRLKLLSLVANSLLGEVCACDLNEPLERSQATVSHHLSLLVAGGLLVREQRGRWAWFSLEPTRRDQVETALAGMSLPPEERIQAGVSSGSI